MHMYDGQFLLLSRQGRVTAAARARPLHELPDGSCIGDSARGRRPALLRRWLPAVLAGAARCRSEHAETLTGPQRGELDRHSYFMLEFAVDREGADNARRRES
jgi:hypothetical protein